MNSVYYKLPDDDNHIDWFCGIAHCQCYNYNEVPAVSCGSKECPNFPSTLRLGTRQWAGVNFQPKRRWYHPTAWLVSSRNVDMYHTEEWKITPVNPLILFLYLQLYKTIAHAMRRHHFLILIWLQINHHLFTIKPLSETMDCYWQNRTCQYECPHSITCTFTAVCVCEQETCTRSCCSLRYFRVMIY
jgi:hypothetical protein